QRQREPGPRAAAPGRAVHDQRSSLPALRAGQVRSRGGPMRPSFATAVAMLGALAASAGLARDAHALTACTAAQVNSQDPGCPAGPGPCSITKLFDVATGCTLDFAARAVTVAASGTLRIRSGAVTVKAGSFTMNSGSLIDGKGVLVAPGDHGGMITIQTTGDISILKAAANGVIDVTGNIAGGV